MIQGLGSFLGFFSAFFFSLVVSGYLPGLESRSFGDNSSATSKSDVLVKIKASGTLRVGLESGFIPFEMRTKNGTWVGFDVDMISAFAKSLGVKPEFMDTKWDGIIPALVSGKFDVIASGMTITEERSRVVQFSAPYYQAGLVVMIKSGLAKEIKSLKDLDQKKYTVALKTGTTGDTFATKNLKNTNLRRFDTENDSAGAVALGKVDAFIYDKPYIDIYASKNSSKVSVLPEIISAESLGIAFRKKDSSLAQAFSVFFEAWKKAGSYQKAIDSYFKNMTWLKDFPDFLK
jgi:polar amino acid transport system substrate-binding protein